MSLKQQINEDMKTAMRAKDTARLGAIRLLLAAMKQREVDERIELSDADVVAIIEKMNKQRRDSISQYEAAGRRDLADVEKFEMSVLADLYAAATQRRRDRSRRHCDDRCDRCGRPERHRQGDGRAQVQAGRTRRHGQGLCADQGTAVKLASGGNAALPGWRDAGLRVRAWGGIDLVEGAVLA